MHGLELQVKNLNCLLYSPLSPIISYYFQFCVYIYNQQCMFVCLCKSLFGYMLCVSENMFVYACYIQDINK